MFVWSMTKQRITRWLEEKLTSFCSILYNAYDFFGSTIKLKNELKKIWKICPMYTLLRRRYPRKEKHIIIF